MLNRWVSSRVQGQSERKGRKLRIKTKPSDSTLCLFFVVMADDIVAKLVQLLTFWFSDANLSKDRFLKKTMASNEKQYVPFATFLTFKKVQELNAMVHHLQAAAASCSFLKISRDGSMVRRAVEFTSSPNELQRTVYADCISDDATHDSISQHFSRFGSVVYVSIPRQKDGSIKGCAFIEFSDEASAAAAVAASPVANMPVVSKSAWLEERSRQKSSAATASARETRRSASSGRCLCLCGVPAAANGACVFEIVEGFAPVVSVKFFSGLCYVLMRDAAAADCALAHFKASGQRIGGAALTVTSFADRLLPAPIFESFFKSSEETRRNVHKGCIMRLQLNPIPAAGSEPLEAGRCGASVSGAVYELRDRFSVFGRVAFVNYPSSGKIAHIHFMSPDHAAAAAAGATRVCSSVISSEVLQGEEETTCALCSLHHVPRDTLL
jgi:RNA recognition motif-containing protein